MRELLKLEDIQVSYGAHEVVSLAELTVREGEFCALLGLNGCGKTTLLHAACGLLPMRGRVLVDGTDCTRFHEKRRARLISLFPQTISPQIGRSVLDAVLMGCYARLGPLEHPSSGQVERAERLLEKAGIGDKLDRDFETLSQGEKQLAVLARCMLQDTPVLLMDEPDSALDFKNRHAMLGRIRDSIHANGRAGLVTLHDPNSALAYCDRVLMMSGGKITQEIDVRKEPPEREVAQMLSALYGEVEVHRHGGRYYVGISGGEK